MDNSKEAHNNMTAKIGLHQEQIISHMVKPMTCDQIADRAGMTYIQVVRRCSELERRGLIERCEEKFTYVQDGRHYHRTMWRVKE